MAAQSRKTLLDLEGGLEWCEGCRRLLTLSHPERDCKSEYCPLREDAMEESEEMDRDVSGPAHNKGTDAGWH